MKVITHHLLRTHFCTFQYRLIMYLLNSTPKMWLVEMLCCLLYFMVYFFLRVELKYVECSHIQVCSLLFDHRCSNLSQHDMYESLCDIT